MELFRYLTVTPDGREQIWPRNPKRFSYKEVESGLVIEHDGWEYKGARHIEVPEGTIEFLTGRKISFTDDPICIITNIEEK